jgi:hypothetical protein
LDVFLTIFSVMHKYQIFSLVITPNINMQLFPTDSLML